MKTITDHIRSVLYKRLEIDLLPIKISEYRLMRTEWCHKFEKLQRNRMLMGSLRYGRLGAKNKKQYDRCADIKRRINLYEETGNLEYLVDVANLCQCEFVEGNHSNKHFLSTDDNEHTKEK